MIKNVNELNALRDIKRQELKLRHGGKVSASQEGGRMQILVCGVAGCLSSGSLEVASGLENLIKENHLEDEVKLIKTGCMGLCVQGPLMVVYPDKVMYTKVKPEDVEEIYESHIKGGKPVERLMAAEADGKIIEDALANHSFYSKQMKIALKNCGQIDPYSIEEYIGCDGYQALAKVLGEMEPEDVVDTMKASNLRGRGGAGFPTGVKWSFAAAQQQRKKYVCCNADEGDPGAFMDRSVLEGDPHSVLEAMAIAGYAIGSDQGYIYVRAEYPVAVKTLAAAIEQAKEYGLLGENILGKGFNFDIEVRLGAGAFVCGEETALMTSIEGNRGEPRPRPPFPAVKGLFGQPTILNNVETYATIPRIILNGVDWFNSIGTEKSKGTKVFAVGGKIARTGLVEVPMGTTLREIVFDMCGGIPNGKAFKAAQTGGPSGGCIPASALDTPIDYDNLIALGSMMGSGGLIVMDEDTCMVDLARFFLDFTVDESCGKCVPCRLGTKRMHEILTKITEGRGTLEDIDKLEFLANNIKNAALCGLGQTAPNPVLSTLRYFRDEYVAHVVDKRCPAGVCKAIVRYKIDKDTCKKCGICKKHCPVGAIEGDRKTGFTINRDKCIKCGVCMEQCPFKSVLRNA
ncbi:MAG: NADH-quinone oxidoreductase subunit NuoF [Firmicutes bacterium]|nr:NADH-quinone oxidoreductase subunit NuoF [Bacillota bacterium]